MRAVFYGINGTGLGHISRLLNIARAMRDFLHSIGELADFYFITTSEAPQVAWDFPVYKLPSKTLINELDNPNRAFLANSRFFITNLVGLLRPDVLVLDTIPEGSFNEFILLKDFCRKTVFINRHQDEANALSPIHQSHLNLYDLILVPDLEQNRSRYHFPVTAEGRVAFTGIIQGFREEEAYAREEVRDMFDVTGDERLLYVSAGGGGDKQAEADLETIVSVLAANPRNKILVGYGPLYRGRKIYRNNVMPLTDIDNRRLFRGIDAAFSAAGYNTYEELLAARVPTAFFYQVKGLDRQDERVELGLTAKWHLALTELNEISILGALKQLLDPASRNELQRAMAERTNLDGASQAAAAVLKLHFSHGKHAKDYRNLYALIFWRRLMADFIRNTGASATFEEVAKAALKALNSWPEIERNEYLDECLALVRITTSLPTEAMMAKTLELLLSTQGSTSVLEDTSQLARSPG